MANACLSAMDAIVMADASLSAMETGDAAQDKANMHYAAALAQREGYRLSLQTHKILEIP